MQTIWLTQGYFTLVDDDDYTFLSQFNWHTLQGKHGKKYAGKGRGGNCLKMHRVIMNTPDDMQVDHKDGDTLNNQKYNLRNCTNAQNTQNSIKHKVGYKGVRYLGYKGGYMARIKQIYLGCFETPEEAAIAYNNAAIKYFGEFANLNKIEETV
jgi:hypothetical protein